MNRLVPLIDRRQRQPFTARRAMPVVAAQAAPEPAWLRDSKLFAVSYLAGIVVFSTFLA